MARSGAGAGAGVEYGGEAAAASTYRRRRRGGATAGQGGRGGVSGRARGWSGDARAGRERRIGVGERGERRDGAEAQRDSEEA